MIADASQPPVLTSGVGAGRSGAPAAKKAGRDYGAFILCAILAAVVWTPGLYRTYWADEAGTFWMAHEGWRAAIANTLKWPGQSVLYSVVVSFFSAGEPPLREALTRMPSVLASVFAAYLLYRFAERLAGRGAGVVASAIFITHPSMLRLAVSARPYAMAMAACIASFYCLYEWLNTGRRRYWILYVIASITVIYLHYLFAFIFLVQCIYLVVRSIGKASLSGKVPWRGALLAGAIIAASVLPLLSHILLLFRSAHTLPFAGRPAADELFGALLPLSTLFAAALAWIWIEWRGRLTVGGDAPNGRDGLILIALWWLAGPLFFFAVSTVTPMAVFVERYVAFSIPAVCLLIAYASAALFVPGQRRQWLWIATAILAFNPLMLQRFARPGVEEYGPAVRIVNNLEDQGTAPVFVRSPLIESNYQNWQAGASRDSYLFAPVVAYPLHGPMIPLPNQLDDAAKAFIKDTMATRLSGARRILMLTHWDDQMVPWISDYMKGLGYSVRKWQPNAIWALEFWKNE